MSLKTLTAFKGRIFAVLGLSLRHGQESSPCLSGTNASLYTSDGFSVHTKTEHGNARCRGKSVYVPARRRRDRLATFTILGDGGVPMPEPELNGSFICLYVHRICLAVIFYEVFSNG